MKIYWKVVAVIFVLQLLLGVMDARSIYHCHTTYGSECWPWFGIFVANIPSSILADALTDALTNTSFQVQLIGSLLIYVVIGTLWWSLVIHLAMSLVAGVKSKFQGN